MKTFLINFSILFASFLPLIAEATSLQATVTADNHYAIYVGNKNGSNMRFIGRNEMGPSGSPGLYNWSLPETWNVTYSAGEYLYIAAWSDNSIAQGLIGEFSSTTENFLSGLNQGWEVALSNVDLGDYSPAPSLAEISNLAAAAPWNSTLYTLSNGTAPWSAIPGISLNAQWMWGTPNLNLSGSGLAEYQVFRRGLTTEVPEPGTVLLLGSALLGLPIARRRKAS